MGFFTKWMAKRGSAKSYPKEAAESYVAIREHQPSLNIYAVIPQIIRRNLARWSFSQEQGQRLVFRARSIAQSSYNPSDYHVLLKFCSELPYVDGNTQREHVSPDLRKALHDAALEGLNEGLGSYLYDAKSLYTTRSAEGLDQAPVSGARSYDQSGDASGQDDDDFDSAGFPAEGLPGNNYELAETRLESILEDEREPARAAADDAVEEPAFSSEIRKINRYMDRLYPPLKKGEVSVRCFELPERHVLFIFYFNGGIRSRVVSFSPDTTRLHFDLPDIHQAIDICLSDRANEKTFVHLCLSLMNDSDFHTDVRRSIKKGRVPVFSVIATDEDRTIRLTSVARALAAGPRDSEAEPESKGALDA